MWTAYYVYEDVGLQRSLDEINERGNYPPIISASSPSDSRSNATMSATISEIL